ncbi:hypothetical protein [Riemerella columbina]|uniref:hypothetical protein n=1 Tax=Riemerella columbina TaxID=103810 RepID=UPI002670B0A6|nr:hypothetical protein [Riemerella columbina]WKS95304.1 hypothetical protein NYR17_00770 [Riemerella columbina]
MHQLDPPKGFKGKEWKDKDGTFTRNEDGSYDVSNSPDKIGKYKEIKEVILTVKSKLRQNVDNVVAGLGINTSIKEGLLESVKLNKSAAKYLKLTKRLGVIGAGYDIFQNGRSFVNNPSLYNTAKLGISIISVTNPWIGLGLGILDVTGGTDWILTNTIGK